MWTLHTKDESHYVPISIVSSFKRMREYQALGVPWIANALRKSTALEVDEAGENVRRRTEVLPPRDVFQRSVYAKGFGTDDRDGALQKELEVYFAKWGTVHAVRMRRDGARKFKVLQQLYSRSPSTCFRRMLRPIYPGVRFRRIRQF